MRRSSSTTSGKVNQCGNLAPLLQPAAQLGAGDVEDASRPPGPRPRGTYCVQVLDVDHLLNGTISTPSSSWCFCEQLLGVVGAVERLALRVVAGAGMVAADDEVGAAVVLADERVPDRLARAAHAHRERQQRELDRPLRILGEQRLVAAHAGVVVDVARLGHAHRRDGSAGWPRPRFAARSVSSTCARCMGLRVWNATTRRQPSARELGAHFGRGEAQCPEVVV